ncbi:alpha/beta fold hydrolase [Mycobacterium sp.]|jgi:polyhydroxyalkanoate synthase|uniref:alpha/beta fold hydrolase n=1 Tax=Mycobacterium sp. TaxID=1785 RepID=UPI002B6000FF|nr:alpha/beta fold hydrolase [Mycobacterium sp.]HTH92799.1 alpha/beta fold hydrolase [Mycobacterium sp.]
MTAAASITRLANYASAIAGRPFRRVINGLRLAASLDRPGVGCTPRTVIWSRGRASLMHYTAGADAGRPAILLVPSLINRSYIWDLRHGDSFVEHLLGAGYDVLCLDWGLPDARDAHNTMSTYIDDYMMAAVAAATRRCASVPIVIGHCFGSLIAVLWAASTEQQPPALITLAAPTNWDEVGPLSWITRQGRIEPEDVLDETGNVPPAAMLAAFRMIRPLGDAVTYVTLVDRLHDREATQAIWALTVWARGHIPFPGATFVEMIRKLSRENSLTTGKVAFGGRIRELSSITAPFLNIYGSKDHVAPPESVKPLTGLVGSRKAEQRELNAGHIGLLVGSTMRAKTMPTVIGWLDEVLPRDQTTQLSAPRSNSPKSKRPRVEANGVRPKG